MEQFRSGVHERFQNFCICAKGVSILYDSLCSLYDKNPVTVILIESSIYKHNY